MPQFSPSLPDEPVADGASAPHVPLVIYESDSEDEVFEDTALRPSAQAFAALVWIRSGAGAVHVAAPVCGTGAPVSSICAACGAYWRDPVTLDDVPPQAKLCQHRACCKLRNGL